MSYLTTSSDSWGSITTKTFRLDGPTLLVNCDAKAGSSSRLNVEILDPSGIVIPGFGRDHAITISGSDTDTLVEWKSPEQNGNRDLRSLVGTNVRIRFHMKQMNLYAFQIKL